MNAKAILPFLLFLLFLLTGHQPQEVGRELLTGAFSSLLGILYGYLRGGGATPAAPGPQREIASAAGRNGPRTEPAVY